MQIIKKTTVILLSMGLAINALAQEESKETGCISGDCENGFGVFIYPDKDKYIGQFKNGLRDGRGSEVSPDGMYTITNWKEDNEHGFSKTYNKDNELILSVEMNNGNAVQQFTEHDLEIGCIAGDCENGFGHYVWESGSKYIGEFINFQLDGQGTFFWPDENKFVGMFSDGLKNGYGRQYGPSGDLIYEGILENDIPQTDSTITPNEGTCIFGDCANGYGILVHEFDENSMAKYAYEKTFYFRYEGTWKNGEKDGIGFLENGDASSYVGQFSDGYGEGRGIETGANGDVYKGEYRGGRPNGQGTITHSNGSKYTGDWSGGEKEGNGITYFANGDIHEGEYDRNKLNGQGTMVYSDGSKYIGEWYFDKKDGQGEEYNKDGKLLYSGKFNNNERVEK